MLVPHKDDPQHKEYIKNRKKFLEDRGEVVDQKPEPKKPEGK